MKEKWNPLKCGHEGERRKSAELEKCMHDEEMIKSMIDEQYWRQ